MRIFTPLILCTIVAGLVLNSSEAASTPSQAMVGAAPFRITLRPQPGVAMSLRLHLVSDLAHLHRAIGRDLRSYPAHLSIQVYASHRSFARALWRTQRTRPQNTLDDTSSIVHDTLLLGPAPSAYLWHNLAHVYTEWIIDRTVGNRSDTLPSDPWLYDGLAEYEAYRQPPHGLRCSARSTPPFDVTRIRTAQQWLAVRAGPQGSLEYCLAYLSARSLVQRAGWSRVVTILHRSGDCQRAAERFRYMAVERVDR